MNKLTDAAAACLQTVVIIYLSMMFILFVVMMPLAGKEYGVLGITVCLFAAIGSYVSASYVDKL